MVSGTERESTMRAARHQESIAAPWEGLDVPRCLGVVSKRLANLAHAGIQTLAEVDEGVAAPDMLPDFVAGDDLAAPVDQQCEHLQGLRL
jgi:hypothetical protein